MVQKELLTYALLAILTAAVLAHTFYPRYEWRSTDLSGSVSIIVYDRWTGRFQRAVYDEKGNLNVMGVYRPF